MYLFMSNKVSHDVRYPERNYTLILLVVWKEYTIHSAFFFANYFKPSSLLAFLNPSQKKWGN